MKRNYVFLLCFVAVLTTISAQTHFMGNFETIGVENGYEWVDLGLPSGLKWATCNVGATKPKEYGDSFKWGETTPVPEGIYSYEYKWGTVTKDPKYKYLWNLENLTKYNTNSDHGTVDNKTILDPEDDAATVNMGGRWRMPTDEEFLELRNLCRWKRANKGYKVIGPNGNSIFLPTDNCCGFDRYLTRSLDLSDPFKAKRFYLVAGGFMYRIGVKNGNEKEGAVAYLICSKRYYGSPVRGVCE